MTNQLLENFFSNVAKLSDEYEQLKLYACQLHDENLALKESNQALTQQNNEAKQTLHQIIEQLKELQP